MRDNLYKIIEKSLTLEREIIQYPQNDSLIFLSNYCILELWSGLSHHLVPSRDQIYSLQS